MLLHHADIPLPSPFPHYPSPQILLSQISTTVLRVSSFGHHILRLEADSKALPDPIEQDRAKNGVFSTLASNSPGQIVVALEFRRRSGRTMTEKNVLNTRSRQIERLNINISDPSQDIVGIDFGTTFNLGTTQQQKKTKEDVVLPHFVAQKVLAGEYHHEGVARIEYTLDAEDDFDDEEDVDEDLLI